MLRVHPSNKRHAVLRHVQAFLHWAITRFSFLVLVRSHAFVLDVYTECDYSNLLRTMAITTRRLKVAESVQLSV